MPSGQVHHFTTLAAGTSTVVAMVCTGFPTSEIVAVGAGFATTFFINPDLDLNTAFPGRDPRRWLWWAYWYPYSRLLPHRHFISHFPIISTLVRVLYAAWPFAILGVLDQRVSAWFIPFIIGMIISDTLHFVMDVTSTSIKRFRNAGLIAWANMRK